MKKLYLLVIIIIAFADQASKLYVNALIDEEGYIEICSFIKLIEVWNSGISFGLFSTLPYRDLLFSVFAIIIINILLYLLYQANDRLTCIGFTLMIGGAIGNVVDRIYWKAVYDFIHFHIGDWYWPAFNLADCYIAGGMLILMYKWYIYDTFICQRHKAID
ncbi:signal peptidase II [Wolbachia pipientis]|uniref:Lipoprotein signal peptidase n=1 Tax=Wolbachia pipientis TaxID=955 RepID=A0A1E7QKV7_WOLPI|nr:signal peptidase II [Wolbachia pipientis]OEY87108.1 signal peptidase II [Wolbachia pipientis]